MYYIFCTCIDCTDCISVAQNNDYIVTGGDDRKMRYWDMHAIASSFIMSGVEPEDELLYRYTGHKMASMAIIRVCDAQFII